MNLAVRLSDNYKNNENCQYIDENGNLVDVSAKVPECEQFKSWVEAVFTSQGKFAARVGYSRQQINEYCSGKQSIPKCLRVVWEISQQNDELRQKSARMNREIQRLKNA